MSTVDIPDQAMDVAWRTFTESFSHADSYLDHATALADAITAAAPLIAAAELRRLLEPPQCRCDRCIHDRIAELDPPGGAS